MATAKQARETRGLPWLKLLVVLAAIIGGVAWYYAEVIAGYSQASTGYAAKYTCSCRYIGGRDMGSCQDDLLAGMGTLWISEDADAKSVTASVPLIESTTATYSEGAGCALEEWDG
ncbi:hypothetical protein [Aurantiacibacter rhizosphaerae]|uniref:Amidase n=1 Tax=Aurantiacibacter rhizosphaerae TaxID=2691582 RepID=A0A844X939_9SPHN|nr:hypothetical protein [Aurantiacibacter rhizosphaerae]MWV26282.1 hypothetical protein [Aurantiacibacter rhizosphaerae]